MLNPLYFVFTAAASAAPVGDVVLPKTRATAVNVSKREAVLHVVYCRNSSKLVLQSVRLLIEKLSNSTSCLKFRHARRISQVVFLDLKIPVNTF